MDIDELEEIESLLRPLADVEFVSPADGGARGHIGVRVDGKDLIMEVRRDFEAASAEDADFVVHSLATVRELVDSVRAGRSPSLDFQQEVAARAAAASPAPWQAFIEADGALAGCDVIRVSESDDEPDMYLWIGGELAQPDYFRFVASARQVIPRLLDALRAGE